MNCTSAQHPRTLDSRRRRMRPARRGVALLLVLGVVVMASVLGYAMLSSAAMQKQATTSAGAIAGAQGMAESGVNLAIYYLQNPGASPTYPVTYPATADYDRQKLHWTGTGGKYVDFGSPSVGSVKVAVERKDPTNRWKYEITSFGRAPGSSLERKVVATVQVNAEYRAEHVDNDGITSGLSAVFTNDSSLTSNTLISGIVYSNAGLGIREGGAIGYGIRRKPMSTQVAYRSLPAPRMPKIVPTFAEIRRYETYEFPAGTANQAAVLSVTNIGGSYAVKRLDPTIGNAAGVYYAPGDLTLHTGAVINGTLIVGGNLTIVPALLGGDVQIRRAQPGFPALIVAGNMNFKGLASVAPTMHIEGLTYVGGRIDGTQDLPLLGLLILYSTLDIKGALLVNGTSPVFMNLPLSAVFVNYDRDLAYVPDLSEVGRTPMSVKVNSWEAR